MVVVVVVGGRPGLPSVERPCCYGSACPHPLKLPRAVQKGWVSSGAHPPCREVAARIVRMGYNVLSMDSGRAGVKNAQSPAF